MLSIKFKREKAVNMHQCAVLGKCTANEKECG